MQNVIKATLVALVLSGAFAAPVAAGPFEDGYAAYFRGDYATAFRLWHPLADQGLAKAQSNIGLMYSMGQGVTQDYAEALKWYRKAAEQGLAVAQFNLALMYGTGRGVPQDDLLAHMWFNLAAATGHEDARKGRAMVANGMTPAQIAEAQQLARAWKPNKHVAP